MEQELKTVKPDSTVAASWGLKALDCPRAWGITKGSKDIVVAIIDTGIDIHHPALKNNLWVNKGETGWDKFGKDKATNKIDDDGNGFVDDVNGWNFVGSNNILTDEHGHGTHIAGIVSGVAPKTGLMVLKYYDAQDTEVSNLGNTVKAIDYAVKMNVNIINYSAGGITASPEEKAAIERAMAKGILFVAAAGNERSNSDYEKYYPADYNLSNILSVTAVDRQGNVLPSSNFGEHSVDIAAPGNDILSTLPNGLYGYMTGTSQATAFVTGVAALVMASNSSIRQADQIRKYITQTGDSDNKLIGKTRYHKKLNCYKALTGKFEVDL